MKIQDSFQKTIKKTGFLLYIYIYLFIYLFRHTSSSMQKHEASLQNVLSLNILPRQKQGIALFQIAAFPFFERNIYQLQPSFETTDYNCKTWSIPPKEAVSVSITEQYCTFPSNGSLFEKTLLTLVPSFLQKLSHFPTKFCVEIVYMFLRKKTEHSRSFQAEMGLR